LYDGLPVRRCENDGLEVRPTLRYCPCEVSTGNRRGAPPSGGEAGGHRKARWRRESPTRDLPSRCPSTMSDGDAPVWGLNFSRNAAERNTAGRVCTQSTDRRQKQRRHSHDFTCRGLVAGRTVGLTWTSGTTRGNFDSLLQRLAFRTTLPSNHSNRQSTFCIPLRCDAHRDNALRSRPGEASSRRDASDFG
jgi:hypothetical protein